ncbi:MAG: hypothetical protein C0484_22630 [Rhodospirillum sp.]|nr:hypothetical protein [Rhodospirillum sp.]
MRGQWDEADIRRSRIAYPRHLPGAAGQRLHGDAGGDSRRRRRSRRASDGNCDVGVLLRLCDRVRALQGHHPAQRSHPRFRGVRGDCRDRGPGARSLLPPSAMDDLPAHDGLRRRPFCRNRKLAQRQINTRDPGKVFSVYMVATYPTFGGSQFVLLLSAPEGALLFQLGAMILCLALILVATTRSEQPMITETVRLRVGEVFRAAPIAAVGCLVAGINSGAFFALMPVFGHAQGHSVLEICSYIALAIFGGMLLQVPAGKMSDRFDRRVVAGSCALAFGALAVAIPWARGTIALEPLWLLLGGFMSVIYPVCVAHANDRMPAERAVAVSGRLILIFGVGSALGPLLGSAVMSAYGVVGLLHFMAATAGLFASRP